MNNNTIIKNLSNLFENMDTRDDCPSNENPKIENNVFDNSVIGTNRK